MKRRKLRLPTCAWRFAGLRRDGTPIRECARCGDVWAGSRWPSYQTCDQIGNPPEEELA
jgi:ribosomal protein L37AE/L43A